MRRPTLIIECICFDRERVFVQAPFFHDLRKVSEVKAVMGVVNQTIEEHQIYPAKARVFVITGDYKPNRKWINEWIEVDYSSWDDDTTENQEATCYNTSQ